MSQKSQKVKDDHDMSSQDDRTRDEDRWERARAEEDQLAPTLWSAVGRAWTPEIQLVGGLRSVLLDSAGICGSRLSSRAEVQARIIFSVILRRFGFGKHPLYRVFGSSKKPDLGRV